MSLSKKIKYFKQIAILLTICWTFLTSLFVVYQFINEEKHIEQSSLEKIKGVAEQSVAFVYWAYEQKAKALSDEQKYSIRNNFSLRDLLAVLARHSDMDLSINSIYKDIHAMNVPASVKQSLLSVKETKQDTYNIFYKNERKYLFYAVPMLANHSCISCHVHDDEKIGALLGFTTISMQVPTFREANAQSYYFLIGMYLGTWCLGLFAIWWIHAKGRNYLNEKTKLYEESMYALIDMVEKRDSYTAGHSQRVAEYAKLLTLELGYSHDEADFIYKAGMLHDIGKIEIPDSILLKPDTLSAMEYSLIQRHSTASYELLSREPFSALATIVLHHHERYDGRGYPSGLKGEQIPIFSQIITVADAFDAMTTNRAYRKCLRREEALFLLEEESGKQFNPSIVAAAKKVFKNVKLPENTTQMPKDLLEEMRFSYYFRDQLTGFYNINYLKFLFAHAGDCSMKLLCIDHLNCTHFAEYNKRYGWKKGDLFLRRIAQCIHEIYPEAMIVRAYSDNFLVIHTQEHTHMRYEALDAMLEEYALSMEYQHLDIDVNEPLSLEILEDKLLRLEN
ncbi:MAG: HD domain-containing protein [Epsilonproteobacteria bacterium]|nr:HD domain-containing protein [Campylobacterota bacterium]